MQGLLCKFRLSTLMTLAVCIAVALTVALQLTVVNHFAVRQAHIEAELRLQQLSWQMRDALNRVVEQATGDARLLAALPSVRQATNPATARVALESLQQTFPDYAWIGLADTKGKVVASTMGLLEGNDVSMRPWFQVGLDGVRATDYHAALLLEKLMPQRPDPWRFVDVSTPVFSQEGELFAVLGLHLSWEWARRQAHMLLTPALREYGAEILVVRDDGTVLLGPQDLVEEKIDTDSLRRARLGDTGALREVWPGGRAYLTGFSQTGQAGNAATLRWSVLVRQDEEKALQGATELKGRMLGWSVLLGGVLTIIAALLARRLAQPMTQLGQAIERVTEATARERDLPSIPQIHGFHEANMLSSTMRTWSTAKRVTGARCSK